MEKSFTKKSHTFGAASIWATWAFVANFDSNELTQAFISSLTQGTMAFFVMSAMLFILGKLYWNIPGKWPRLIIVPIITISITHSFISSVHYFVNTPNIMLTVAPSVAVSVLYCVSQAHGKNKELAALDYSD